MSAPLPRNALREALRAKPLALRLDEKTEAKGKRNRRSSDDQPRNRRRGGGVLGQVPRQPLQPISSAISALNPVARSAFQRVKSTVEPMLRGLEVVDQEHAAKIRKALEALPPNISDAEAKRIAKGIFDGTERFNFRDFARTVGIKAPEFTTSIGDRWRREHVEKIKTLSDSAKERVIEHLAEVGERGTRVEVLAQRIAETGEVSERKARNLAKNAVLNLNATLTKDRHAKAGITHYKWLAIGDGSSRQWHKDLDGKTFAYDAPPLGGGTGPEDYGHPGDGIACRCQAIPVVPEFEEDVPAEATPEPEAKPAPRAEAPSRRKAPTEEPTRRVQTPKLEEQRAKLEKLRAENQARSERLAAQRAKNEALQAELKATQERTTAMQRERIRQLEAAVKEAERKARAADRALDRDERRRERNS